jgi:hypothetical protein
MEQKNNVVDPSSNPYTGTRIQTEGAVFVVYRQPMALDRFAVHDVRPSDTSGMTDLLRLFLQSSKPELSARWIPFVPSSLPTYAVLSKKLT